LGTVKKIKNKSVNSPGKHTLNWTDTAWMRNSKKVSAIPRWKNWY